MHFCTTADTDSASNTDMENATAQAAAQLFKRSAHALQTYILTAVNVGQCSFIMVVDAFMATACLMPFHGFGGPRAVSRVSGTQASEAHMCAHANSTSFM